ncbi:hypothetical protein [Halomicrococcus gelatinilyticus]|uniref:hypothetical protein n=1 Tax=Halomicrococcus gelatinilyticus TaxID=1702103 RepID=UPI002E0DDC02
MKRTALILSVFLVASALGGGSVVAADADADDSTAREQLDGVDVVDENDELDDSQLETVRSALAEDEDAMEALRDRFDDPESVTLAVHGVDPSGHVHLDATAPGAHPETAVVVDLDDETVEIEDVELVSASESETRSVDVVRSDDDGNVTFVTADETTGLDNVSVHRVEDTTQVTLDVVGQLDAGENLVTVASDAFSVAIDDE